MGFPPGRPSTGFVPWFPGAEASRSVSVCLFGQEPHRSIRLTHPDSKMENSHPISFAPKAKLPTLTQSFSYSTSQEPVTVGGRLSHTDGKPFWNSRRGDSSTKRPSSLGGSSALSRLWAKPRSKWPWGTEADRYCPHPPG